MSRTWQGTWTVAFDDLEQYGNAQNANVALLIVLANRRVISRTTVAALPTSGQAIGDAYIILDSDPSQPNALAYWDGAPGVEDWVYTTPNGATRWVLYSLNDGADYAFNGTTWAQIIAAGGGARPVDVSFSFTGAATAGQVVGRAVLPVRTRFAPNYVGSHLAAEVPVATTFAVTFYGERVGGDIALSAGGATSGNTPLGNAVVVEAGALVEITGPDPATALADFAGALVGEETTDAVTITAPAASLPASTVYAIRRDTFDVTGSNLNSVPDQSGNGVVTTVTGAVQVDVNGNIIQVNALSPRLEIPVSVLDTSGRAMVMRVTIDASDTVGSLVGFESSSSRYMGFTDDGSSSTFLNNNVTMDSIEVDGVDFFTGTDTRDELHAAVVTGSEVIVAFRNITALPGAFGDMTPLVYPQVAANALMGTIAAIWVGDNLEADVLDAIAWVQDA